MTARVLACLPGSRQEGGIDSFAFDTDDYPAEHRVARYEQAFSPGATARAWGPAFRVAFSATRLDDALIYERHANDVIHERTAEKARDDGFDHFVVTAVLGGRFAVATGGALQELAPDTISILSLSHPMTTRCHEAHLVTFSVARTRLSEGSTARVGPAGLVLDGVMARFLRQKLELVASVAPDLSPTQAREIAGATCRMIDAAIAEAAPQPGRMASHEDRQVSSIKDFIEASLADPELGLASIVAGTRRSRSTIYRQFHAQGGVSSYIRMRRLRRLAIALVMSDRPFDSLAAENGFSGAAHASRAFQRFYGIRPGQYRQTFRGKWQAGVPQALMDVFLAEVLPEQSATKRPTSHI